MFPGDLGMQLPVSKIPLPFDPVSVIKATLQAGMFFAFPPSLPVQCIDTWGVVFGI